MKYVLVYHWCFPVLYSFLSALLCSFWIYWCYILFFFIIPFSLVFTIATFSPLVIVIRMKLCFWKENNPKQSPSTKVRFLRPHLHIVFYKLQWCSFHLWVLRKKNCSKCLSEWSFLLVVSISGNTEWSVKGMLLGMRIFEGKCLRLVHFLDILVM